MSDREVQVNVDVETNGGGNSTKVNVRVKSSDNYSPPPPQQQESRSLSTPWQAHEVGLLLMGLFVLLMGFNVLVSELTGGSKPQVIINSNGNGSVYYNEND